MERRYAFIGFGEAGSAFASACAPNHNCSAFDRKTDAAGTRTQMWTAYSAAQVRGADSPAAALDGAHVVFSLVTADQAVAAAEACAPLLNPGALWLDMNSVAPDTKRAAAAAIEAAGGRYADVAVMAPVRPALLDAPLLVSGSHIEAATDALSLFGFTRARVIGGGIGAAASVKMIRSVIVKGIEALTAEAMLAAEVAGVCDEVIASLDASDRPMPWAGRADYNLDRMIVHGTRRAAEMDEVIKTLDALGAGSIAARAIAARQREIGGVGIAPPKGLDAKLAALLHARKDEAA